MSEYVRSRDLRRNRRLNGWKEEWLDLPPKTIKPVHFYRFKEVSAKNGIYFETEDEMRQRLAELYQREFSMLKIAELTGMSETNVRINLCKTGVTFRPKGGSRKPKGEQISWNGCSLTCAEWAMTTHCQERGFSRFLIQGRRAAGWPPDRIFTEPVGASSITGKGKYDRTSKRTHQ